MALKLHKWDGADCLKTEEDMALYFEASLEDTGDDAAFIAKALGNIARAGLETAWRACARLKHCG
jgi:probable addiction module antidote protein